MLQQTETRESVPTAVEIVGALTLDIGGLVELGNGMYVERLSQYWYRIDNDKVVPLATALTIVDESYRHICPVSGLRCADYNDCHNATHCWLK